MNLVFGFALFVVGFAMLMGGVALLIGGEITLKSGKKITKPVGRKAAMVLLSFFPLAGIVLFVFRKIVTDPAAPSAVVTWPLALACLFLSGAWLLRGMHASVPRRSAAVSVTPLVESTASSSEPVVLEFDIPKEPSPTNPEHAPRRGKNPFDFS